MLNVLMPAVAAPNDRFTAGAAPAPRLMIAVDAVLLANAHDVRTPVHVAVSCTVIAGLFAAFWSVKPTYGCGLPLVVTDVDADEGDIAALSTSIVLLAFATTLPPVLACTVSGCAPGEDAVYGALTVCVEFGAKDTLAGEAEHAVSTPVHEPDATASVYVLVAGPVFFSVKVSVAAVPTPRYMFAAVGGSTASDAEGAEMVKSRRPVAVRGPVGNVWSTFTLRVPRPAAPVLKVTVIVCAAAFEVRVFVPGQTAIVMPLSPVHVNLNF